MDQDTAAHGQMDFNLPHDVVTLPSGGLFYKSKKKSVKVGYLTASDENILVNIDSRKSINESVVLPLLRNKIYEPGFDINQLLDVDVQAILVFLRNTSFGSEYTFRVNDPVTSKMFLRNPLMKLKIILFHLIPCHSTKFYIPCITYLILLPFWFELLDSNKAILLYLS